MLKLFKEHGFEGEIGIGVSDVHVNEIESPELIRDRILYAAKALMILRRFMSILIVVYEQEQGRFLLIKLDQLSKVRNLLGRKFNNF